VTEAKKIESVSIVGVGLIGGSFALALRAAGFSGDITGVSSPPAIEAGIATGAIARGVSLEEAAATADLLYLAQPVSHIIKTIEILCSVAKRDCLITDAGSAKSEIARKASECLSRSFFLGGHPMAGKEQRGAEAAEANLFRGRPYVLCPTCAEKSPFEDDFRAWLSKIGADVLEMSPEVHDSTVALTSHLPQLLSTALAETLAKSDNPYLTKVFGPGLIDMTRLALSSPDLWLSILTNNKVSVAAALDDFIEVLTEIRDTLDSDGLRAHFQTASEYSSNLRKVSFTS
jgi:prephenate dehydrogenase